VCLVCFDLPRYGSCGWLFSIDSTSIKHPYTSSACSGISISKQYCFVEADIRHQRSCWQTSDCQKRRDYLSWLGNANDPADYQTTTNYPKLGRWGNGTNQGTGTFQIVDLGAVYSLNGVGYNIDWDGAFKNSLTFRVEVSTDNKTWRLASEIVHPYSPKTSFNKLDIDVAIPR
jgi:hypothetical protein